VIVRYKKSWAYFIIAIGALILLLGGIDLLKGVPIQREQNFWMKMIFGVIIIANGLGCLIKPYVIFAARGFVFKNLIGPGERTTEFNSLDRVRVENNKILIRNNGGWERLPISKLFAHNDDWQALIELITSKRI
jgi:cytochrome b subunit of formate dehydrogenase